MLESTAVQITIQITVSSFFVYESMQRNSSTETKWHEKHSDVGGRWITGARRSVGVCRIC